MFQPSASTWRVCVCVIAIGIARAAAAQPLAIDLARTTPGTTTSVSVDPATYSVTFTNLLPGRAYIVSVQHQAIPIPPFPVTAIPWLKTRVGAQERLTVEECSDLQSASETLSRASEENRVPELSDAVTGALDKCKNDPSLVEFSKSLLARTRQETVVTVAAGEQAIVEIQRSEIDAGHPAARWSLTVSAGARGEWLTSYGFSVGPSDDQRFFTKSTGDNQFQVTREEDVPGLMVIPSVYFSWQSSRADRGSWAFSPTVGFGVTSDAPAVVAGVLTMFNRNLGFVAGVAVSQQTRLSGQYSEGQTVSESLTPDQLHRDVWRPAFIIGATLRFTSNPFGDGGTSKGGATEPAAPAPPAPAPPAAPAEPGPSTPAGESAAAQAFSFTNAHRLFFTEGGFLSADSAAEQDRLLAAAAGATDVFVLSHGWWNSPGTADCSYRRMVDGLRERLPSAAQSFKPVVVGIYWPSVIFPTETAECDSPVKTPGESLIQGSFETDLAQWAAAAFPAASRAPSFPEDRARVMQLLGKERRGEGLSRDEAVALATVLDRWRRAEPQPDYAVQDTPAAELFTDSPAALVDQWMRNTTPAGSQEAFGLTKVLNFTNAFTFWTMKTRAGTVGSRGVFDLVHALRERGGAGLRIHLIGHSFGGRVVSAAVAGRPNTPPNQVDSLIILEGAFSHFAFATREQIAAAGFKGPTGGLFEAAVRSFSTTSPAVRGRLVAMFSEQDVPNQVLYPAATMLKGSDREAARVLRFGSIGADGVQGPAAKPIRLETISGEPLHAALRGNATRIYNVDASNVVKGHSDLNHPQVFDLIWGAVLAGRNGPR